MQPDRVGVVDDEFVASNAFNREFAPAQNSLLLTVDKDRLIFSPSLPPSCLSAAVSLRFCLGLFRFWDFVMIHP